MPKRRHLNAAEKRALKAASAHEFVKGYGRKAQKGIEPNDRSYDEKFDKALRQKQVKPEDLDRLLRDDEE